ncbi:hypothetical protein, partial [Candidatus Burkholderia verschuerenii]|uniref:hypothetical protein n=1 Tax=Candidatus Burkholderia verschuerenii TaxID=242163 RepID=UPI001E2CA0A3
MVETLMRERKWHQDGSFQQWSRIETLERDRDEAQREIDRLRLQVQHQEERMYRVRMACEETVVVEGSSHAIRTRYMRSSWCCTCS